MGRYVIRRLLWVGVTLLLITLLTYLIFFVMPPTDPAVNFAGKQPTPELVAEVKRQFGLDKPMLVQYGLFVKRLFLGDEYGWPGLGFSFNTRAALKPVIAKRLLITIQLAVGAAVLWLVAGVAIGILSALRPRSIFDRVAMGFALLGVSAPVFFVGPVFLWIFWFKLRVLPGTGFYPIAQYGLGEWFLHMIMPWTVLALAYAAIYARLSRANLIETMGEDYIRTARAKGLSPRRVTIRHGLRASLTPIVTVFGLDLGGLLGGAIITETVFNLQGIGNYAVSAVFDGDLYAILDVTVIAAFFIVAANLVVDILYAFLDPRVRYS
ncbi:MAG: ABC transporter permease [Actinomycetota bacterium]